VTGASRQLDRGYGTACRLRTDGKTLLLNIIGGCLRRFCSFRLRRIATFLLNAPDISTRTHSLTPLAKTESERREQTQNRKKRLSKRILSHTTKPHLYCRLHKLLKMLSQNFSDNIFRSSCRPRPTFPTMQMRVCFVDLSSETIQTDRGWPAVATAPKIWGC